MAACAHECKHWRRHHEDDNSQPWLADEETPCPVRNGQDGVWVPLAVEDSEERAELRAMTETELQMRGYGLGRYGQLQQWQECAGCAPREAEHGVFCTRCLTRFQGWFTSERNLAWCWYWLAQDLIPGQSSQEDGKRKRGKKAHPPAAMNLEAHELRQDILAGLGGWLATVCGKFHLDGPGWFRRRLTEARRRQSVALKDVPPGMNWRELHEERAPWAEMDWRAWLPQDAPLSEKDPTTEIQEACRYLAGWLDRVCTVEDLAVSMYDQADRLYRQVRRVAPWEATAQRMPDLVCPACEREALVRWEGDEHLTCRRCKEVVPRQRYDVWSAGLEAERVTA